MTSRRRVRHEAASDAVKDRGDSRAQAQTAKALSIIGHPPLRRTPNGSALKHALLALPAIALAGCAVLANVQPIGDGMFMTAVHSNDVNGRLADEKAKAMDQASAYCADRHATLDVTRVVAAPPAPGQPPSAEVDFRCKAGS